MGCLGNLIWFICGGAISGLSWCLAGCLWCITIIGIPVGMQCFKFCVAKFLPVREGCRLRRRSGFLSVKYHLVACIGTAVGFGAFDNRDSALHYDYRNSLRFTAV